MRKHSQHPQMQHMFKNDKKKEFCNPSMLGGRWQSSLCQPSAWSLWCPAEVDLLNLMEKVGTCPMIVTEIILRKALGTVSFFECFFLSMGKNFSARTRGNVIRSRVLCAVTGRQVTVVQFFPRSPVESQLIKQTKRYKVQSQSKTRYKN